MSLINVMRHIAREQWKWDDDRIDVALSVYIQRGTLTDAERSELIGMPSGERNQWLVRRVPVDAIPAAIWDFEAHGFFGDGWGPLRWADGVVLADDQGVCHNSGQERCVHGSADA